MEPIKDPKFDVDKMIDSVIDYTESFLTGVKEVVKSGKELEEEKFITYWFSVMNTSNMSSQQCLFFTHLINELYETGFFKSPASIKYHGNYRCGLVEHSIGVFYYMLKFYREEKNLREIYSMFDIMITALCHDLCKIGLYFELEFKYDENTIPPDVKLDKDQPKFIKNYKRRSLGHGEQSIWTLKNLECKIKSEHNECDVVDIKFDVIEAIRWHMGQYDLSGYGESEYDRAKRNNKLVLVTHYADDLTSSWDNR